MLKKLLVLPLLFAAAIFFTGCSDTGKEKVIVGVSIPSADHGWTGGIVFWAQKTKKELEARDPSLKILLSTASDSASQVSQIENMMVQKIKALVVLPHEPAPLAGVCREAQKKGAYLVVVDRNLAGDFQDLAIAGDNPGFGRACGEVMAKELKGKGDILIMEGALCDVNTQRVQAFREVMKKYPGIRILDSQTSNWSTEQGLTLMENYLRKYPKVDAVWAGDDDVLVGALKAYQESKRKDIKLFVGGGGSKIIVKKILDKDPLIPVNVTYPPEMIAHGIRKAVEGAKGKADPRKKILIKAEVITRENAAKFYNPDSIY